jgi:hypothetical protein
MKDTYENKTEISRIAAILDPKLPDEWDLPDPPSADGPTPEAPAPPPKKEPKKRRR